MQRLANHNLRINKEKSVFLADKIDYCGYTIDANGIYKMQSKIDAILNTSRPTDKVQLQSLIGLINYYGRF